MGRLADSIIKNNMRQQYLKMIQGNKGISKYETMQLVEDSSMKDKKEVKGGQIKMKSDYLTTNLPYMNEQEFFDTLKENAQECETAWDVTSLALDAEIGRFYGFVNEKEESNLVALATDHALNNSLNNFRNSQREYHKFLLDSNANKDADTKYRHEQNLKKYSESALKLIQSGDVELDSVLLSDLKSYAGVDDWRPATKEEFEQIKKEFNL